MHEKLTQTNRALMDRIQVIQSLGEIYTSLYYIDLSTGLFTELSSVADVHAHIGASGKARDRLTYFCRNMVAPEHQEQMLAFVELSTLHERMAHTRIVSKQYMSTLFADPGTGRTWRECSFIEGDRDAGGRLSHVIFTTKSIHDVKVRELEAQQKLKEESAISTALSREYSSLFKIDAKTRKMTLYRTDGISFDPVILDKLLALGDFEQILSQYIDSFVVPEDRDRLRESIVLSVLLEKVPEVGLYKLGYRRIKDGVVAYFEMNTVKTVDENGDITFILGLRDVDEEARRQLKQTREMEVQREIIEGLGSEYYSVLLVNPDTDEVAVYRAEEAEGRAIAEFSADMTTAGPRAFRPIPKS